ncbi:MAG: nitrous oxide reductase family maturation protein NosD [bacterium]
MKNEEGKGVKPHPIVRVFGMILILSALVFVAPWRGDETTPKGLDSPFQIHQVLDAEVPNSPQKAIAMPTQQYVGHERINITKNADFAALGFPGEGSLSNPYTIEGLNIKAGNTLIHIQDTTVYFHIRNNLLTGSSWESHGVIYHPRGIYLQNVEHGTIDANTITGCGPGILLNGSEQTSVSHNTVSNSKWPEEFSSMDSSGGISLVDSWNNNIVHNNLSDNYKGIRLSSSGQNTLVGNILVNNGLDISGGQIEDCLQAAVAENVVNGRPVVYWQSVSGGTVPPDAGQVLLINTTGIEVTGQNLSWTSIGVLATFSSHLAIHHNTLSNNRKGISLSHSWNSSVAHNTLSSNRFGISLWDARHTTISNNTLSQSSYYGIDLMYSDHNTVAHNTVSGGEIHLEESGNNTITYNTVHGIIYIKSGSWNNTIAHNIVFGGWVGIELRYSEHNTVTHNTVSTCKRGIALAYSWHNTVSNNTVFNCEKEGIVIWDDRINKLSVNNMVTWNDFLDNHPGGRSQANDEGSNNVFAYNYWDDHDHTDRNGDGIADTPYAIDGNQDPSPLTAPANLPHTLLVPTITYPNSSEILKGTVTLQWAVVTDAWGHSVTYAVSYSADDGHTWTLLASGLTLTSYEWDTTTVVEGSMYLIRVVATCSEGLTAEDVSDTPFTIQNRVTTTTSLPPVGLFPTLGGPVGMLFATLLLTMIPMRRCKRKAR